MGLFNHENLQVSCYKDKKTCRFIKGFRKLICSISEIKRTFKGRLYSPGNPKSDIYASELSFLAGDTLRHPALCALNSTFL